MDEVRIDEGATLGPDGIVLPGATHRRGDDRRPRLAGHARRRRPRGDPLAGQPDHDVALSRKPAAGAARSDRLVPARPRQRRLPGRALRPGPRLQARGQPARRAGRAHRRRRHAAEPVQPRPGRVPRAPRARRRPSGEVHAVTIAARQRQAARHAGPPGRRAGSPSRCATAATRHRSPADGASVGWEELTDGALVASQPIGAPSWFPCNDQPGGQGDLPDRRDDRGALHGRRHRCAHRATPLGRHADVGVRAGGAHGVVPGQRADRPLRQGRGRRGPGTAGGAPPRPAAPSSPRATSAGIPRS